MSITTSLSFTFVNTYGSQPAKPAAAAERPEQAEMTHSHSCGESRPATRQNRLVEAMMSALRELGFGNEAQPAAAAATPSPAPVASTAADAATAVASAEASAAAAVTASAAASDTSATISAASNTPVAATEAAAQPAVSLESAVRQFAHELFSALRQVGRGESSEQGSRNRIDGDGGRRHHHGHHGWRREGYGDMAQRLDALSQTFAAPAAVAAAGPAPVSTSISITLTIQNGVAQQNGAAPQNGVAPAPAESVTTNPAVDANAATAETAAAAQASEAVQAAPAASAPTTAQEVARNPLLDAFSQLFGALKPQAAQTDMADKLRSFLQTLAQAMRPDSMNHATQMPQVGALVNVTA